MNSNHRSVLLAIEREREYLADKYRRASSRGAEVDAEFERLSSEFASTISDTPALTDREAFLLRLIAAERCR